MILVSILGDYDSSILPIFYEFKDDISKHILVYDDFKNDVIRAKAIKKGIKAFKKKYNYQFELLEYVIDEDSMEALVHCSEFLLSNTKEPRDLFINTTDGLSNITAILNYKLIKKGVSFISYDRYDNQYNILNSKSLEVFDILNQMSIQDHFLLKGYKVETSATKLFAKQYTKQIRKIFEVYSDQYDNFTKLAPTNELVKYLPDNFKKLRNIFIEIGLGDYNIKHPMLTGMLFEAYTYVLIKNLKYDDIEVGLKVNRKYKNSNILNEFDILIIKNNHLHMIECKYQNKLKLEELIYKYIALSEIIDDDGKMMIVTKKAHSFSSDIDNDEHRGKVYKRGKLSNISVTGAIHKDPIKFVLNVEELFGLKVI